MKYRKKPIVIEAIQWTGDNFNEIRKFCPIIKIPWSESKKSKGIINIPTLEGTHGAERGDWIIKGVRGEFYPCKPDIFEATYEKVEE